MTGTGNMAVYNKLANLVESASVVDGSYAEYFLGGAGGSPQAAAASSPLAAVGAPGRVPPPTARGAGAHPFAGGTPRPADPTTVRERACRRYPAQQNGRLRTQRPRPFLEETARFTDVVGEFLAEPRTDSHD